MSTISQSSRNEGSEESHVVDPLNDSVQKALKATVDCVRASNLLPKLGIEYELYSSYPDYVRFAQENQDSILATIHSVLNHAGAKTSLTGLSLDDQQERLIDSNDIVLERVGILLDDAAGLRKVQEPIVISSTLESCSIGTSWNRKNRETQESSATPDVPTAKIIEKSWNNSTVRLFASESLTKPQTAFSDLIDNTHSPFLHHVKTKHNKKNRKVNVRMFIEGTEVEPESSTDYEEPEHPYHHELTTLQVPQRLLKRLDDIKKPSPLVEENCASFKVMTTLKDIEELCEILKNETEFAVDLEHHSYRSFQGLTCLMQISTRTQDFLIDTLALRRNMHVLNEVFSDPEIVKVFHGADSDIEWLQRDLSIYVVNMFDTGQAMRVLNYPKFSLAYLIKRFVGIELNKVFQLADWRMRPLATAMKFYALCDTHYLLYCFDMLRNELIDRGNESFNLLRAVFDRSRNLCLKLYQKPLLGENDYLQLATQSLNSLNARQLYALKQIYAWRDTQARVLDESIHYILPNHMLLHIAKVLPREAQGILACCSRVPPVVKQDLFELHKVIQNAREMPIDELSVPTHMQTVRPNKRKLNPLVYARHDYSHTNEHEEIGNRKVQSKAEIEALLQSLVKDKPDMDLCPEWLRKPKNTRMNSVINPEWISPYDQYLLAVEAKKQRLAEGLETDHARVKSSTSGETTEPQPTCDLTKPVISLRDPKNNLEEHEPLKKTAKQKRKKADFHAKLANLDLADPANLLPKFDLEKAKVKIEEQKTKMKQTASKIFDPNTKMARKKEKKQGGKSKQKFKTKGEKSLTFSSGNKKAGKGKNN